MTRKKNNSISIVIPTYNRGVILLNTINYLLCYEKLIDEIIIVDQTAAHPNQVKEKLQFWHDINKIQWKKLSPPSVVLAMNVGLLTAQSEYILFLDDDIKPIDSLVTNFKSFIDNNEFSIAAGRVIQPWDDPTGINIKHCNGYSFNSLQSSSAKYFIGANFLLNRTIAINIGGFDENFISAAHDYEKEFSDRILQAGHKIKYCADAAVIHLKEDDGGIRTYGHFIKTITPHHSVGAYYYILQSKMVNNKFRSLTKCLRERVATKFHLKEPWWILPSLIANILGVTWALYLWISGPKHIRINKSKIY